MTDEAIDALIKDVNVPKGGITTVPNVLKPLTRKAAGDYPLVGGKIQDPTATGQAGKYKIQLLPLKDRYPLIRQSIDDQKENWTKTLQFLSDNQFTLSALQKQNLTYNLGVLQRSRIIIKDLEKGLIADGLKPEEVYQSFVKNKRFLDNEHTGLSAEANEIIKQLSKTEEAARDLVKTTKSQDEILKKQKKENEKRFKELYNGRAYETNDGMYRALAGYHLPKLHEAGIIKLDPKIYKAIKEGTYHHGGADYFAPDPNRVLRYHFGTKIFDDIDDVIQKTQHLNEVPFKGSNGMIDFLKKNDYLPVKVEGPSKALDYLNTTEIKARIKEAEEGIDLVKSGNSPIFKTPDQMMDRIMQTSNEKKQLLEAYERIHPEQFKLYQKKKTTQPFFGEEISSDSIFSDLADIREPKDKAKVLKFPKKESESIDLSKYDDDALNALVDEDIKLLAEANKLSEAGENYGRVKAIKARREEIAKILKAAQDVPESGYDNFRADLAAKKQTESQIKTKLEKPGQGKFTKAEYLIQRLKNTIKDNPDDKYVQETFPNFIKELEADPKLAKDEHVFRELGGDLPKDQQIVVYDDDTLDFFTQKEGPGNIALLEKFMKDNPFLSREEGLNLLKMEPTDRVLELTKLRHLNKKKTDNAEGGIIGYALGGQII